MAIRIKSKNSVVKDKAPLPTDLEIGELALNAHQDSPAIYLKDAAGTVRKVAGLGSVSTVDATDAVKGIVELATAAETTTGTDATRAVTPAGLKVELDKKANLASPALTGTPTAPTAAAGTNTTQLATTAFVHAAVAAEDLWNRTGTEISPKTAGDSVFTSGAVKVGGTTAAPNLQIKADGGIVANTDGLVYDAATKRLGLGTSSPATLLHLNSATGTNTALAYSENNVLKWYNRYNVSDGSFEVVDVVNTATRLHIANTGNVGIGTTTPQQALHVLITGGNSGAIQLGSSTYYGIIEHEAAFTGANIYTVASASGGGHIFKKGSTEQMRLDASGRLLVGTSTDSGGALLQVNGDRVRIATAKTPASATAAGVAGEICWDASYVYVCVAANTWKRSAIATW